MINYYEILQIEFEAKPSEIRRAFRKLAKKCHPDLNRKNPKEAEEHFRRIRDAFDTLINPETRRGYDQKLRAVMAREENSYPEILKKRKDDPQAQSRLILHHLLNENHEEAVRIFEDQVRKETGFSLQFYLDEKDWLDGEFLLGEAYERLGNWRKALLFYESVYREECESPLRYFLEEVKERIRDIYCKKIARRCSPLEAIEIYKKVMSMGFLVDEDAAMIWRGPMVHGAVRQLLADVAWGELDYLVVDLPPGTGDAPLTLAQTAGVAGAVVVSTPQALALADAIRAAQMYQRLGIHLLGFVENMSYFVCPHCGREHDVFGRGGAARAAERLGVPVLAEIPLNLALRANTDEARAEADFDGPVEVAEALKGMVDAVLEQLRLREQTLPPPRPLRVKARDS